MLRLRKATRNRGAIPNDTDASPRIVRNGDWIMHILGKNIPQMWILWDGAREAFREDSVSNNRHGLAGAHP